MLMQSQIIDALAKTKGRSIDTGELASLGFPQHYIDLADRVGVQEITPDFALPPSSELAIEKLRLGARTQGWLIFGFSVSGDMWLIRSDAADDQVAFLTQDEEAGKHPQPMGINILQWFELAFTVREHEAAIAKARSESEKRTLKQKVKKQLDTMSPGLSQRYPYSL